MKPLNLFNIIKIKRKTDILALAAFLISILALGPQLVSLVDFSDIHIYHPEDILIVSHFFSNSLGENVRFAVSLTFENKGHSRYRDVIKKEYASMEIKRKKETYKYNFIWSEYVLPEEQDNKPTEMKMTSKGLSQPFRLKGGDILTHMTYFTPCPKDRKNYLKWGKFKELINEARQIKFIFGFSTFDGDSKSVTCLMKVSKITRDHINIEKNKWIHHLLYPITE